MAARKTLTSEGETPRLGIPIVSVIISPKANNSS
jgi:hypothetical protein